MAQLSINLGNIRANHNFLKTRLEKGCKLASVVKADAYGLGMPHVAKTLKDAGCTTFFVATLPESLQLRMILGEDSTIATLNGYDDNDASFYIENNITPVLNDIAQVETYKAQSKHHSTPLPAIAHIDTGMNRLGMNHKDIDIETFDGLNMLCLMSHFASSEEKDNPLNAEQNTAFEKIAQQFPLIPKSLCNSSGIFLSESYHYDWVRPGMALYGLNPTPYQDNPMQPVIALNAKILQIHNVEKGEVCGYNETHRFDKSGRVAILDTGYADGLSRHLSNNANVYWKNTPCPIRGTISMDLTIVDLTHIPDSDMPQPGDMIEIIGPNQSADDLAKNAGTIGYEVLTSLGRRFERTYINP